MSTAKISFVSFYKDDPDSELELECTSTFPRLVLVPGEDKGSSIRISKAFLCAEGGRLLDFGNTASIDTALMTRHASYYVFNASYQSKWKDVFIFIDAVILGVKNSASKRISIQKFISALHSIDI